MTRSKILQIAKPILFNTNDVLATMDGRKTVTRRVVKPQYLRVLDRPYRKEHPEVPDKVLIEKLCNPPYKPGDYLYVRETWNGLPALGIFPAVFYYRADEENPNSGGKWRPSIHMPKEAARIFLRVTDVRVERLQDITEEGAICEGASGYLTDGKFRVSPVCHFMEIFDSTIPPKDRDKYGWAANPWVWVIEFEKVETVS